MKTLFAVLVITIAAGDNPQSTTPNLQSTISNLQSLSPPAKWQNPTVWRSIKTGQTPDAVRRILGDPTDTESTRAVDIWYYAGVPTTDDNGKVTRPKCGFLMFRKSSRGIGLTKWTPPDWLSRPTWDTLQTGYRTALTDQQAAIAAEKKRIAAETAEQKTANQQAAIEKRRQAALQRRQQALAQRESRPNASQPVQISTQREPRRLSWLLDNIIIISCVLGFVGLSGVFVYKQ